VRAVTPGGDAAPVLRFSITARASSYFCWASSTSPRLFNDESTRSGRSLNSTATAAFRKCFSASLHSPASKAISPHN